MRHKNRILLILLQTFGYLWHVSIYVILIPLFLLMFSRGLDYLILHEFLDVRLGIGLNVAGMSVIYDLLALLLFSLGLLILIESTAILYTKTKGFPFSLLQHKHLQPKKLATTGWYAHVRHPMLLGYLLMLMAIGLFEKSPSMVLWWVPLIGACFVEYYKVTEEKRLVAWFGDEYIKYRKSVPALIPSLRKMVNNK